MSARVGPTAVKQASTLTNTAGLAHKVFAGGLVLLAAGSFVGLISLGADLKFGKDKRVAAAAQKHEAALNGESSA
jgi:hypothetical protein